MRAASCSVSTVSSPARPGATIFGPPEKPAKKCGSTKPVVILTSASSHSRFSQTGHVVAEPADPRQRGVVAGVVVDDPDRVDDLVAEHRAQLRRRVAAVGAGRDEEHDVVEGDDAVELVEDRGDHDVARLRARDVTDADRDRLAAPDELAQRPAGERVAQRAHDLGGRVRRRLLVRRDDHGRAVVRKLDLEAVLAVCEAHLHEPGNLGRWAIVAAIPSASGVRGNGPMSRSKPTASRTGGNGSGGPSNVISAPGTTAWILAIELGHRAIAPGDVVDRSTLVPEWAATTSARATSGA